MDLWHSCCNSLPKLRRTGDHSGHGDSTASVSVRASSGGEAGPSGGSAALADGGKAVENGLDESLQKRLEALIVAHPVMLFMKGAWPTWLAA